MRPLSVSVSANQNTGSSSSSSPTVRKRSSAIDSSSSSHLGLLSPRAEKEKERATREPQWNEGDGRVSLLSEGKREGGRGDTRDREDVQDESSNSRTLRNALCVSAAAAALAIASRAYASDGFDLDIFRSFSTSATASLVDPSVSLLSESPSLSLSFLETAVLAVVADAQASLSAAEEAVSQVSQEEMQNLQEASEAASEAYKSAPLPSITDQGLNPALFLEQSVQRVQDMGTMGFAYFVLVYVIAEVLCVPALPLTASAGYLFGVTEGTLTVLLAGTAACAISFLLARTILRPRLQTMFADNPRFRAVDRVVQKESFKVILILRLSPLLPFGISNYLYGLTSVEFIPYILASVVGFIPGTLGYVYSGQLSHQVLSTGTNSEQNSVSWLTAGLILVSVFALSKLITEKASEALKEIEEEEEATAERERAQAALEAQGMLKGGGGGGGEGEMRLRSRPFDLEEEGEITEESTLG